jgi:hypothetical protein
MTLAAIKALANYAAKGHCASLFKQQRILQRLSTPLRNRPRASPESDNSIFGGALTRFSAFFLGDRFFNSASDELQCQCQGRTCAGVSDLRESMTHLQQIS